MASDTAPALILSGDDRIQKLLSGKNTLVTPASACILDGFVNDTFTPYTNASVFRTAAVCKARVPCSILIRHTPLPRGKAYVGFTMYTEAGREESVDVWVGHRKFATALNPDPDNRLHLFVVPEPFSFKGGEVIRLVTGPSDGPCRIENIVYLPRKPAATPLKLEIRSPHVDLRHEEDGICAYLTWTTGRPASGELRWGTGKRLTQTTPVPGPGVNHEIVLRKLNPKKTYRYEIHVQDRTGALNASHTASFNVDPSPPESRVKKSRIPLLVRRPAPGGTPWPVSAGVPFPKGALGSSEEIRLVEKGTGEIPSQARTLARWDDGSVRWALLDFQSNGETDCSVEYGRDVSPAVPEDRLEAVESPTLLTVSTGPIRVEFPRDQVVLPGIVSLREPDGTHRWITPAQTGPAVTLIDAEDRVYTSERPDAVVLEESGPERACVRVELTHKGERARTLFRSVFRVFLFRNSSLMRVMHTFENDRTDAEYTCIRELSLRMPFDLGGAACASLGAHRVEGDAVLTQTHDNRYLLCQDGQPPRKGKRFEGVLDVAGDRVGVSFAVRDFWQHYPKGVSVDATGILFQVCPPLDAEDYPRGGELEDRLYYYLLDGVYKFKHGVSKTHEFWLRVRPGDAPAPAGFSNPVQTPPLYSVSLSAFNRSRAITQLPARENSPYPPYEEWVESARTAYAESREMFRAYGMLNYGDWFGERTYNWGNLEYDATWTFLQEYLRGGHPDFYAFAEEAARHLADVDTCHSSADAGDVGGQYTHCVGHVGGYYPDGYRERAIFSGRWSPSHLWVEGPFLYHLLSGDARALDSAMKTCNLLAGEILNDYDFTTCRNSGWHLIHLAAAYKTTGRRVYLNAARIIVDRVLERQRPSGGWDRLLAGGHCTCLPPRHTGNAGFMVGILTVGLKRFYEATGEKRVRDAIVRAADCLIDAMWEPEQASFHYTSCPESRVLENADIRLLKAVATAYRFTKADRFKTVLQAGIRTALAGRRVRPGRGIGKSICSPMRGAPQVLVDLPDQ